MSNANGPTAIDSCIAFGKEVKAWIVEHSSIPSRVPPDLNAIQEAREQVQRLREEYARHIRATEKQLKDKPEDWWPAGFNRQLSQLGDLLELDRKMRYAPHEYNVCFKLPDNRETVPYPDYPPQDYHRGVLAGRMLWLQREKTKQRGEHLRPIQFYIDRYHPDTMPEIQALLPDSRKWILDFSTPLNTEWMAMAQFAGQLTLMENHHVGMLSILGESYETCDEVTRPSTWILQWSTSGEIPDDAGSKLQCCAICHDEYTEPVDRDSHHAVILRECKHVFGQKCLKQWISSGEHKSSRCPTCWGPLITKDDIPKAFPTSWHEHINAYMDFFEENQDLNQQVDDFLLQYGNGDMEECYEYGVKHLLSNLSRRYDAALKFQEMLNGMAKEAATNRKYGGIYDTKDLPPCTRITKYWGHDD